MTSPDNQDKESSKTSKRITAVQHIVDTFLFRGAGFYLWLQASKSPGDDWDLIVGGLCAFLLPDVLRGKDSLPAKIIKAIVNTTIPPK